MASKLNTNTSIVDYLKSVGQDSSYSNRSKLAQKNGISNYTGTAEQNVQLLNKLKNSSGLNSTNQNITTSKNVTNTGNENSLGTTEADVKNTKQTTQKTNTNQVEAQNKKPTYTAPTTESPTYENEPIDYNSILKDALTSVGQAPQYQSSYTSQIDGLLNQILNRQPFTYNQETDPMYQQYKSIYTNNANKNMRDTMGNASSLTGGYGSSYAGTVGSQAYDNTMSGLNNMSIDLYNSALNKYNAEGAQLQNNLNSLISAEDIAYQKYLNSYNQWTDRRDNAINLAEYQISQTKDDANQRYNEYLNNLNQYNYENEQNYGKYLDALNQYNTDRSYESDEAYRQSTLNQSQQQIDNDLAYNKWYMQYQQQQADTAAEQWEAEQAMKQKELEHSIAYDNEYLNLQKDKYNNSGSGSLSDVLGTINNTYNYDANNTTSEYPNVYSNNETNIYRKGQSPISEDDTNTNMIIPYSSEYIDKIKTATSNMTLDEKLEYIDSITNTEKEMEELAIHLGIMK